jgi:hypothetical protein
MGWLLLSCGAVTNIANESTTNPSAAKATHSTARANHWSQREPAKTSLAWFWFQTIDLKIALSIEALASGIGI